ncbi:MAG: cytochrome-c oxidase, cbb3-type subunit I [Phycisphaerae bacterium]|jgi:cytochrome c oxidase cbb3-type subunit I/II|nr:cytochrome-c oxidase, cbb3-type subunit I [Phycisphaerae bacterium]
MATPTPLLSLNAAESAGSYESGVKLDRFSYDDAVVRKFVLATVLWGVVGMLVGVIIALQLAAPYFNFGHTPFGEYLSYGRLRPLHTNAVIFAFAGNALFGAIYYSTPRLLKTPMFSRLLSNIHFWGWQAIIVSAALTLPLGITQGKEYAELEWPIDIAVVLIWVVFALNFFGTLATRRERHLYVAVWFYIATVIAIAVLYIFNNIVMPAGWLKSYSIYAGSQDAFMQWWYGHNAVAFFLTTPFLGLMYYFLPKAADRPVFSYRLSIVHFWSLVFIYIWAGPHHLHYTSVPEWASTLGMLFSVMLWMPSWGGMLNGLLTLRGAWHRVAADPILKFYVVAVTFYGMSTFEGPLLSVKSVNALSHYTDWTIAHVHAGALGWVGFMSFGMAYWLAPRLFQTGTIAKPNWVGLHFWLGTIGMLLYIIPIYAAGLTQGLMWRAFNAEGFLQFPDFIETVTILIPMYWFRVLGGGIYLVGAILCFVNILLTWARRPKVYDVPVFEAAPLAKGYRAHPIPGSSLPKGIVLDVAHKLDVFGQLNWHRKWEGLPLLFTIFVVIGVVSASLFEIIPLFTRTSDIVRIKTVTPYSPLELTGREIYIAEGCANCHSQMIRPMRAETDRYGEYSKPGEAVYDHPFLFGSRRVGPDLARVGKKIPSALWHLRHLNLPTDTSPGSIMPSYPHLVDKAMDWSRITANVNAMVALGVDYDEATVRDAERLAKEQAKKIADQVVAEAGPNGMEDKQVVALIAYLMRLGTDLDKPVDVAPAVAGTDMGEPIARHDGANLSPSGSQHVGGE